MLRSGVADEAQQPKGIFASEGILAHELCLHIAVHNGEEDDMTQDN